VLFLEGNCFLCCVKVDCMPHKHYVFEASQDATVFAFTSQGKVSIAMRVRYIPYPKGTIPAFDPVYDLQFEAWDSQQSDFSVWKEVNNEDTFTILSTVVQTMPLFSECYPQASILFMGSTDQRGRVFDWYVKRHQRELSLRYDVRGYRDGYWELLAEQLYGAFLLSPKKKSLSSKN
jgi:hypothetical protein